MKIIHERLNGTDVMKLVGRLDAVSSKGFRKEIATLTESRRCHILLDLSELEFVDSSGLGALVSALRTVNNLGGDIRLAAVKPEVRAILELTRLHRVFAIYSDRQSAEKSFEK